MHTRTGAAQQSPPRKEADFARGREADLASIVAAAMKWTDLTPGSIAIEEKSGHSGAKTFKVSAPPGTVALHWVSSSPTTPAAKRDSTSEARMAAASDHFAAHSLAPQRLCEGGDDSSTWFIESWGGKPIGTPTELHDGHTKVVLVSKEAPGRLVFEHSAELRQPFPSTGRLEPDPDWAASTPVVGSFGTPTDHGPSSIGTRVPLTLSSHPLMAVGERATVVFGPFQLRSPVLVTASEETGHPPVSIVSFDGVFLTNADGFVLDVAHGDYHANQDLHWLREAAVGDAVGGAGGGGGRGGEGGGGGGANGGECTRRVGGGRDWTVNKDGTISPSRESSLVLGVAEVVEEGCGGGGAGASADGSGGGSGSGSGSGAQGQATASVEELGKLLARIHSLPTDWFDGWRDELARKYEALAEAHARSTVWWQTSRSVLIDSITPDVLRRFIRACPTPRTVVGARAVTSHADFQPANILRAADGALLTVDYEHTCVTSACQDIAWALLLWLKGAEKSRAFVRSYLTALGEPASAEHVDGLLLDAHAWRLGLIFGGEGRLWEETLELSKLVQAEGEDAEAHSAGEQLQQASSSPLAARREELIKRFGARTRALVAVADEARTDAELCEEILSVGSLLDTSRGAAALQKLRASST
jgi:hypothetical protein